MYNNQGILLNDSPKHGWMDRDDTELTVAILCRVSFYGRGSQLVQVLAASGSQVAPVASHKQRSCFHHVYPVDPSWLLYTSECINLNKADFICTFNNLTYYTIWLLGAILLQFIITQENYFPIWLLTETMAPSVYTQAYGIAMQLKQCMVIVEGVILRAGTRFCFPMSNPPVGGCITQKVSK